MPWKQGDEPAAQAAARAIRLELRVAPDADALLAREAAASRLREEAEAVSAASARVVEKLVRENGALVERIETLQTSPCEAFGRKAETETPSGTFGSASGAVRRGDVSRGGDDAPPTTEGDASSPEEEEERRERPRGLWAFISGADRAPAKYVPRRAIVRAASDDEKPSGFTKVPS